MTAYAASRTPNAATIATIQNPKKGKGNSENNGDEYVFHTSSLFRFDK
jgi:hypothetical protein